MAFIKEFKEKRQLQREAGIREQAELIIRLADFDNDIYIAYNGTPLVPVKEEWTSKEIISELSKLRSNYINSKLKENGFQQETYSV